MPPPDSVPDKIEALTLQIPLLRSPEAISSAAAEPEKYLSLPREWFGYGTDLCAVRIADEAMSPILTSESVVVIDRSQRKPDLLIDRLVAVSQDGRVLVRWLRKNEDDFFLVPQQNSQGLDIRRLHRKDHRAIVGAVALIARR